jgi:hypothetical protein
VAGESNATREEELGEEEEGRAEEEVVVVDEVTGEWRKKRKGQKAHRLVGSKKWPLWTAEAGKSQKEGEGG